MGKVSRIYSRREVEHAFMEAFDRSGGVDRLVEWAADPMNYGEFLKLMIKFAPREGEKEVGQAFTYVSNVPSSGLNRPRQKVSPVEEVVEGEYIGFERGAM